MTTYTVRYKKFRMLFWRKIRNVEADGLEMGLRWFVDQDGVRYEVSVDGMRLVFSAERGKLMAERAAAAKAEVPA